MVVQTTLRAMIVDQGYPSHLLSDSSLQDGDNTLGQPLEPLKRR